MKKIDRCWGLGFAPFVLVLACQESDLPIGDMPEDGGESSGGAPHGTAGSPPTAGTTGMAGASGGAGATGGDVRYEGPTAASLLLLKSGDPAQPTPPVLAPIAGGVVVAGASADPETVGLDGFETGVESEAFAGRLTVRGFTWTKPLLSSGLPRAIAKTPDGDFVIDGAYLPNEARISPRDVSTSRVLNRIDGEGTIVYDSRVAFDVEMVGNSLAVDSQGAVFLGGGVELSQPLILLTRQAVLVKCTDTGDKLWDLSFQDTFGRSRAINAVAVLPNDDVLAAGAFDLTSGLPDESVDRATIARFTTFGDLVWSVEVTGSERGPAMLGALLPLEGGDFLVAGSASSDFTVNGAPFDVPESDSEIAFAVFVARFDGSGNLRWLTLDTDSYWPTSLAIDDRGTAFVALEPDFLRQQAERVYLRSFDLGTGTFRQSFATTGSDYTWASSVAWSDDRLWVAGGFTGRASFGEGATYDDPAGVFVAHLDPED